MTKPHLTTTALALGLAIGDAFSGPARSGKMFGGPATLYKDDDPSAVMEAIGKIETKLSAKIDARLDKIKADGLGSVPDVDKEIKRLEGEHTTLSQELKGAMKELETKMGRLDVGGGLRQGERKSSGELFTSAEEFKNFRHTSGNRFSLSVEQKALTGAVGSVGSLLETQRLPMQDTPTEPHIRDLIPSGETSARSLKFPQRKAGAVNNAAMVAEGGAKPQSDFGYEMVTTEVKKIAHYIKASDEILEDEPALRSYIDAQLIDGLRDVEDAQILKGDGTGQNLLGLYTVATAYNRAATGTMLDVLIRAQTQLRLVNRTLTGYVLNPEDWETIMLLKGTDNNYIWLNVLDGNGNPRIMAKPVRDSTKLAKGEWLAGDFRRGAQLFDRRQANITVANQNEDDFVKNMVTILAEERLALVIYDRLSFIKNAPA
ncbi:phage major capsid protein [Deinococcus sp. PEB2-63]